MANPWEKDWSGGGAKKPWERDWSGEAKDYRGEGGGRGTGLEAALIGARQGVTFGFGDEINAGVRAAGDFLGGQPFGESYDKRLEHERGLLEQTREESPAISLGGEVGGAVLPALLTGGGSLPISAGKGAALGAGYTGAYAFGEGEGGAKERVASALKAAPVGAAGGAATAGLVNAIGARSARKAAVKAVPGVDKLKGQAGALYQAAEESGVKAAPKLTSKLADTMRSMADEANLIAPDGTISANYGAIDDVLKVVGKYADKPMSPGQMQIVRETFQEAAKQPGRQGKIATGMLRKFDEFTTAVAPQLREGDALWSKAMKGSRIEEAVELAGARAGQFSGSGFENALRTEFRALDRKIVKGEIKGLSQPEIEAIKKVARGGKIEGFLRWVGKAAPTSPVNAAMGGGMPFLVGNTLGGPVAGAAAGLGTMVAGTVGRVAATSMQKSNSDVAAALARSGGKLDLQESPAVRQVIEALIAAQRPMAGLPR